LISFIGSLQAQQNSIFSLFKLINLPHAGDSIVKQQVDYIDPGIGGSNISWDFQSVKRIDDHYTLKYRNQTTDTSLIEGIEHLTIYRFKISGDSLFHTGYENSTTYMKYTKPELRIKFPLRLGDTISSDFVGDGEYCHMIKLHVAGQTTVTADAVGTLSTPLGLTFKNALRVKSLREYSQTGIDSVTMSLECYAWYVPKYRYPVFETIKTSTKKIGQKAVEHKVASFFYPPNEQAKLLIDTTNWTKTYSEELPKTVDDVITNCRLMPNPVQDQLVIEYDLMEDAKVSFTLIDNIGRAKVSLPPIYKSAGHYQETLNLDSFTSGIYPIHVRVNDMVKTLKIIKR
jgi:hypothetical protein